MPLPKNRIAYGDIQAVLDAAISRFPTPSVFKALDPLGKMTPGAGINWLQRCNLFRAVIRQEGIKTYDVVLPQRRCQCRGRKDCQHPDACSGHIIDLLPAREIRGTLESIDGTPIPVTSLPSEVEPVEIDELQAIVLAAKQAIKDEMK